MSVNYQIRPQPVYRRSYRRPTRQRIKHSKPKWQKVNIKIFHSDGACTILRVEVTSYIRDIKQRIEERTSFAISRQILLFQGIELDDDKTLLACQLPTAIFLSLKPAEFDVYIKTLHGKNMTLHVKENDTILSIKQRIQSSEGVAEQHQRLIYGAIELDDDRCLKYYNIGNESIIFMALKFRKASSAINTIEIFVKTSCHKISLLVERTHTMYDVKCMAASRIQVEMEPHWELKFGEDTLEDDCYLSDYNIHNRSILFLQMDKHNRWKLPPAYSSCVKAFLNKQKEKKAVSTSSASLDRITESKETFEIYIEMEDRKIELEVEPTDTILSVKQQIEDSQVVSIIDQELRYGERELENAKCLLDYCIECDSSLVLHIACPFTKFIVNKLA